jgi:hypothetical protein
LPYCPNCGSEVEEGVTYCPNCGQQLNDKEAPMRGRQATGAVEHLSLGFNLAMQKPMVFAPVIIGGLISSIIDNFWGRPIYETGFNPIYFMAWVISLVGTVITFVLNFATIDMARDAYLDEPLDLERSFRYVLGRILTFFFASIVAALLSITIVLIPIAMLMMVIIVMDETSITAAISQAFSVLGRDLGDVIVILIAAIIGYIILGFIPMIGDVYYQYQHGFNA